MEKTLVVEKVLPKENHKTKRVQEVEEMNQARFCGKVFARSEENGNQNEGKKVKEVE